MIHRKLGQLDFSSSQRRYEKFRKHKKYFRYLHFIFLLVMKQKIQNSCYSKRQIAHLIKKYLYHPTRCAVYFAN